MNTNEENFSNKLRNKLDDQAWPMPDAAWEGAQALLEGDRRRKRAGIILFTIGLLLLMAGLVPFMMEAPQPVAEKVKLSEARVVDDKQGLSVMDHDSTKQVQKTPTSRVVANATKPAVKPNVTAAQQLPVQPTANKKTKTNNSPNTLTQPVRPSPDNTNGLERNQLPKWAANKKETKSYEEQKATIESGQASSVPVPDSKATSPQEPVATSNNEEQHEEQVVAAATEMAASLSVTPSSANAPTVQPVTPATTTTEPVVTTPTTPVSEEPKKFPVPLFSIQGGIGASSGWKSGAREGAGVVPDAGVMWYARNDRKSYFGIGLHYTSLTGINSFTHTSYTTVYGLGEQSSVKKIAPFKVHYLMLPLRYYGCVGDKLVWGLGINALYLLTTNSHVEEYNTINGVAGESKKYTASGYTEGFNWYDLQGAAEVRYKVMNRWWAGVSIYYGFADIKNAFLTNNNNKENTMGIRLNLIYMIPRQ